LGFGILATYLQFDQLPGIGYPILVAAFLALLFGLALRHRLPPVPANAWLAIPTLFFALMVALRTNTALTVFNGLAVLGLLMLLLATWDRYSFARYTTFGYW